MSANPFSTKTDDVSTVTAAEINAAGVAIERAIDGTAGSDGTPYTPATAIIIGGSGVTIQDDGLTVDNALLEVDGGFLTVDNAIATIAATSELDIAGTMAIQSGAVVTVANASVQLLTGTNLTIDDGVDVACDGQITLGNDCTIDGASTAIVLDSGCTFACAGTATFAGEIIKSGASAKQADRYHAVADSTPQTLDGTYDFYDVPATLTNDTTLNLAVGTRAGQRIEIVRQANADAHTVTIHDNSGFYANEVCAAANPFFCAFIWTGTVWRVTSWSSGLTFTT